MTQRAIDGDYIYFVTTNVHRGQWFFITPERAAVLGQVIRTSSAIKNFDLLAYCILPNHVHLLVQKLGTDESTTHHHTLERVRWWGKRVQIEVQLAGDVFLFPHRRLSSRRCGRATLSDLMRSIKGTYSRSLPRGKFWHRRSYFRIVNNNEYLRHVVNYILYNYRKMNLPEFYGQSPFVFIDRTAILRVYK